MRNPTFPLPALTRFELEGKHYVINGHLSIGESLRSDQYECICITGPLKRCRMPSAEVHAAIQNPNPEVPA